VKKNQPATANQVEKRANSTSNGVTPSKLGLFTKVQAPHEVEMSEDRLQLLKEVFGREAETLRRIRVRINNGHLSGDDIQKQTEFLSNTVAKLSADIVKCDAAVKTKEQLELPLTLNKRWL